MAKYSLWHPLRMPEEGKDFINFERGKGIYLFDSNGNKYIDAECGLWNVPLGYGNKKIINSINEQLKKLCYLNLSEYSNGVDKELAEKLIKIMHSNIDKICFTCSGSESTELAIKFIRKYHSLKRNVNKKKIAVLECSYHGNYYGSLSASQFAKELKHGYEPLVGGFIPLKLPFCRCCKSNNLSETCLKRFIKNLENEINENKDELAGVILEPILGSAGVIPIPYQYMKTLKKLCNENDILLAFDEVVTGFGRTGKMFCYEQYDVEPDILCFSKGINSGYLPMGAVAVSHNIVDTFSKEQSILFHLSTQNGNPASSIAAIKTLEILKKEDLVKKVNRDGESFILKLKEMFKNNKHVFDIRGKGFMIAIDIIENNEIASFDFLNELVDNLRKRGLKVTSCYTEGYTASIVMMLPFIINDRQLNKILNILNNTILN